jgi:hypothetical protein
MLIPNFGMGWLRGSAEYEPQPAPQGQLSLNNLQGRAAPGLYGPPPDTPEDRVFIQPPKTEPDVSPRLLPRAEEFRPHRALTQQEIQELALPGGAERVKERLRMEQAAEASQEQNFMDAMRRALPQR